MPILTAEEAPSRALTPREVTVVRGVVAGLGNREIGRRLFVEDRTVQTHVARAMGKLGVSTRTALAVAAIRQGIVPLHDDPEWWR